GHLGSERFLATIEPWHGNEVVVYRQENGAWKRHVIDESIADGHTISAADFDGDGSDELVVGERQGRHSLYLYRMTNAAQDARSRQVLDDGMPAAGCAVADLNADKRADIVCIGATTLRWYERQR